MNIKDVKTLNILLFIYIIIPKNKSKFYYASNYIYIWCQGLYGYAIAKEIIKLINGVAKVVNSDSDVNDKLKIVFIEDL